MIILNRKYPSVYNNSPNKEILWKIQGYVLFARLKNHTDVFTKVRKEKMVTQNNVKSVDWPKTGNIIKKTRKSVLLNMKDGLNVIQKKYEKIKELIITGIKKESLKSSKNLERKMVMQTLKPIESAIEKKLIAITTSEWHLNLGTLLNLNIAKDVKTPVRHRVITMIIRSLWKSFGFVEDVMVKNIEYNRQRERPSLETLIKGCDGPTLRGNRKRRGLNTLSSMYDYLTWSVGLAVS